ncbi:MAG: hypothetical protein DMG16_06535 [Acidobacteria bacterium]|nr:MAG: hypothetical protein DMG16_06535 [Acidobacteriota bacterium]
MRFACAMVLVIGFVLPAKGEDGRGWNFSGSFNGSSNSGGTVTKAEPVVGYSLNNHFQTYGGVPFYFVNMSSTAASATTGIAKGVGNAFTGLRFAVQSDTSNYSSTLELTAPTGDKSKGFSTGRVTADWTNRFSHRFDSFTPFGSAGIANTISDTAFFVRPFTSLGLVGHFEGGASYDISRYVHVSGSAYAVRASGDQTIISKVVKRQSTSSTSPANSARGSADNKNRVFETQSETVVPAEIANDHGVSAWFGVSPRPELDFHAGYSRSVHYDFNTIFFGIGFHLGK